MYLYVYKVTSKNKKGIPTKMNWHNIKTYYLGLKLTMCYWPQNRKLILDLSKNSKFEDRSSE